MKAKGGFRDRSRRQLFEGVLLLDEDVKLSGRIPVA
jgi:hypothetical protein